MPAGSEEKFELKENQAKSSIENFSDPGVPKDLLKEVSNLITYPISDHDKEIQKEDPQILEDNILIALERETPRTPAEEWQTRLTDFEKELAQKLGHKPEKLDYTNYRGKMTRRKALIIRVISICVVALPASPQSVLAAPYPHTKSKEVRDLLDRALAHNLKDELKLYRKAIAIEPDSADIYEKRAMSLEWRGHYKLALKDIDKAIKLAPDDNSLHIVRSRVLFHLGRYKEALEDVEIVHKSKEPIFSNQHSRVAGACYYHLGKYKRALRIVSRNGKSLTMYYYIGMCHLALDQPEEALEAFDVAINKVQNGARREFYLGRAKAYDKLGKKKLAQKDRQKASKMKEVPWAAL